jgi:hypothetical protein
MNVTSSDKRLSIGDPNHWECQLRHPDGYTIIFASPDDQRVEIG